MEDLQTKYPHLSSLAREITAKRTLNSKTISNPDRSLTLLAHIGHIHYKDKKTKKFENVDCMFLPTDYGWEMRKNNYELEIPKLANDWFKFINTVRVDPRTGDDWDLPDEAVSIKPLNVLPVTGKLISKPEWKGKGIVLYKNAYGNNIDLEVMARNTGFVKEVIINQKPVDLSKDLEFSFEVALDGFEIKPKKKDFRSLRADKIKAFKEFGNDKAKRKEEERWEDELERELWDKKAPFTTSDGIILKKLRKTWFRKFNLTDAEGNHGIVKVRLEEKDGKIILTKILDKRFLENAVYPVRTDATTNYYAGAGDGQVYIWELGQPSQATWDTAHDATEGGSAQPTAVDNYAEISINGVGDVIYMGRGFLPIDTSGLGSGAVVSAAVLKLYLKGKGDDYNGYVAVVKTFQASTSTLVLADYEDCGYDAGNEEGGRAKYLAVKGSDDVDIGDMTEDAYNDFTLNATGRGWISLTGTTMLGIREKHDIEDSFPGDPGENSLTSNIRVGASEETSTNKDPYLEVTYTAATNYEKSLSDSISIAEALVTSIGKKVTDTLSIAEVLANVTTLGLSDSITITEDLVSTEVTKLDLVDTLSIVETKATATNIVLSDFQEILEAGSQGLTKVLADSISIAESVITGAGLVLGDTLAIAENLANVSTLGLSDSQTITEGLAAVNVFKRSLSDALSIAEALAKGVGVPTLTDSMAVAEASYRTPNKIITDAITFAETLATDFTLALSDALSIAETLANQTTVRFTENLGMADAYPVRTIGKNPADTLSIAEDFDYSTGFGVTDSISFAESLTKTLTKSLADTLSIAEGLTTINTFERSLSDTLSIAESVINGATLNLSDSLVIIEAEIEFTTPALTDSIAIVEESYKGVGKILTDTHSIAESSAQAVVLTLSDSLTIAETLANETALGLSDSQAITEASVRVATFERTVQDSLSIAELGVEGIGLVKTDSISITESEVESVTKGLADALVITEAEAKVITKLLSDSLSIAETLANNTTLDLSDATPITESLTTEKAFYLTLADSLGFIESLVTDIVKVLADTLSITETLANNTTLSLSDALVITESETEGVGGGLSDSIVITEALAKAIAKPLEDSLAITESVIEAEEYKRVLVDTLAITEAVGNGVTLGLSDSQVITETKAFVVTLALTDALSISENVIGAGGYVQVLSDILPIVESVSNASTAGLSDDLLIEENNVLSFTKSLTDLIEITELGQTDRVVATRFMRKQYLRSIMEGVI